MLSRIYKTLKEVFGFEEFRDLQKTVITSVMQGNDCLGIMPTGSGKSLCYQLPSLLLPGMTIVVSPLISLMKDQVDQMHETGIKATFLNSSLEHWDYVETLSDISEKKYDILYVAPETLFLDRILNVLKALKISLITIDEAHCISEWGHDFRPEYRHLTRLREIFPDAVMLGLTATATHQVRNDIANILQIQHSHVFVSSFDRPNLFLEVELKTDVFAQILQFINRFDDQSGIIYCQTRKQVDQITKELQVRNISALPYHAGLSDAMRWANQEKFIKEDVQIIVATIAFGMGINKSNVRFIMHTDLPKNIETYYQQIGRAGRDGEPSHCKLIYNYGDIAKIQYFFKDKDDKEIKHAHKLLSAMIRYSEADVCRRTILLEYFGERYTKVNCENCDNCLLNEDDLEDLTVPAQKFLSCIWRTGEMFGAEHIIKILRGSNDKRIIQLKHDQLSTYNIGTEFSRKQWLELFGKLVSSGTILREERYGSLKLTEKAWQIMRSNQKFLGKLRRKETVAPKFEADYDQEMFEVLRKERKRIADEKNVPPFVIFSDKTLHEMATYFPQSESSFLDINGVGHAKCAAYAPSFLPLIKEYAQTNNVSEIQKNTPLASQKKRYEEVADKFNQGMNIQKIMAFFDVKEDTVLDNLHKFLMNNGELARLPDKDDGFPDLNEVQEIIDFFKNSKSLFLKPAYDFFNGKYEYDYLRKALILSIILQKKH